MLTASPRIAVATPLQESIDARHRTRGGTGRSPGADVHDPAHREPRGRGGLTLPHPGLRRIVEGTLARRWFAEIASEVVEQVATVAQAVEEQCPMGVVRRPRVLAPITDRLGRARARAEGSLPATVKARGDRGRLSAQPDRRSVGR